MDRILVQISLLLGLVSTAYSEQELESVEVTGSDSSELLEESGFNVDVISTDEYLNSNKDINQVLNTTPGIVIRTDGGLGSSFKLSLNGLSENQIRYFIDGVPMEDFGSALSLDNFPVNLVESIEVYKGVVPINLSSDALGGAINVVTPSLNNTYVDLSYSYGSFDTQRLAVNANYFYNDYFFSRINLFFNTSDNDYEMKSLPATDEFNNVVGTTSEARFHDKYESKMLSWRNGVIKKSWADELSLNVIYAENENEIQHSPTSIDSVYGDVYTTNRSSLASLIYKNEWDKLFVSAYILKGEIEENYFDTESRIYSWDGSFVNNSSSERGEINGGVKSIFHLNDEIYRTNSFLKYYISDFLALSSSISYNETIRSGYDELDTTNTRFNTAKPIRKLVSSINLNFDGGLNSNANIFYKNYKISATVDNTDPSTGYEIDPSIRESYDGFGASYRYEFLENISISTSFERSIRLPETHELLGDGMFIRQSPLLKPEKSYNYNFGVKYSYIDSSLNHISEINIFFRNAKGFIRFNPDHPVTGIYENVDAVDIKGVELSEVINFDTYFSLNASLTYQELVNATKSNSDGTKNIYYGSKVPNEPFLFSNLKASYFFYDGFYNKYSLAWNSRYVYEYYLHWENYGSDDKSIIDSQLSHDVEASAVLSHGSYNISFAINNITDKEIYDNYRIQKPGRNYVLKLRYSY